MTEKQMKNYVISLFRYKKISDYQFEKAVNTLEELRDGDLLFYYFNMGKLYTAFGNVKDAISYLKKAIILRPEYAATYYNLFKCYVKSNDIKKAQISLGKFLETNNKPVNFELIVNVMNAINLIDKDFLQYLDKDFSVEITSKLGYNSLGDNEKLKEIYFEVLESFNNRDYLTCIKRLELMSYEINKISYPMEVDTLIQLMNCLRNKEIMGYTMCLDDKYKEMSNQTYATILYCLYESGRYSPKSILKKIEEIILNDSYIKGSMIIDKFSNVKGFENYQDMIGYLKGLVREKKAFLSLGEEEQKQFTLKRLMAKKEYKRKQNELSLKSYLTLKEEYNLPICDYYIGKIMFRIGNFSKARKYFFSYLEQGGVKTEKAYMFLAEIEKKYKNKELVRRYTKMTYKVNDIFLRNLEYMSSFQYKSKNNVNSNDSIDFVKNKKMRTIKMKVKDFKEEVSLSINDFYNVDIDGKIIIIRDVLRRRDIKTAKKLLKELEQTSTPQEQTKIKQIQRNKKLYMNQIRN